MFGQVTLMQSSHIGRKNVDSSPTGKLVVVPEYFAFNWLPLSPHLYRRHSFPANLHKSSCPLLINLGNLYYTSFCYRIAAAQYELLICAANPAFLSDTLFLCKPSFFTVNEEKSTKNGFYFRKIRRNK